MVAVPAPDIRVALQDKVLATDVSTVQQGQRRERDASVNEEHHPPEGSGKPEAGNGNTNSCQHPGFRL